MRTAYEIGSIKPPCDLPVHDGLPDRAAQVLALARQGLTPNMIAARLGCTIPAVHSAISRLRQADLLPPSDPRAADIGEPIDDTAQVMELRGLNRQASARLLARLKAIYGPLPARKARAA